MGILLVNFLDIGSGDDRVNNPYRLYGDPK